MRPGLVQAGHSVETTHDLDALTTSGQSTYDLVLSYTSLSSHREGHGDTTPESLTAGQTEALTGWVRDGGAFLGVHSATVSGEPNAAYRALLGGRFEHHPPQFTFTVYPMARAHPITEGIEAFTVRDEFYVNDVRPDLDVHMVALDRGVAHPMVWTRAEGDGRVAFIAMGHSEAVWDLAPYQRLLLQAIDWLTEVNR